MSSTVHATRGVAVPHVSGSISSIVIVMSDFTTVELPESGHYRSVTSKDRVVLSLCIIVDFDCFVCCCLHFIVFMVYGKQR